MAHRASPSLAQLINQSSRLFAALGDARLKPLGLRYAQVPVLAALRDGQALTQADLTRQLGVEQSSMAQLLMRMERDGVIQRSAHEQSPRASRISVTPPTARRLSSARKQLDGLDAQALDGLEPKEVSSLLRLLERVRANLERIAKQA